MSKRPAADVLVSRHAPPQPLSSAVDDDELTITMLGAGQEVGRSCCVIKHKNRTVVCDAGVHPALTGLSALPFIDELDWSTVDALIVTHFHLDHAGSLPYIMQKTNFSNGPGRVYMTYATKEVFRYLMQDYVRTSSGGEMDDQLFSETDMLESWRSIIAVDFHEETHICPGLKFTALPAGHVLGAAMLFIEFSGLKVLYTGDISREQDRHLQVAQVPPDKPDVLIVESTFGTFKLPPRQSKELQFTSAVRDIVLGGGRCLIPVFALGWTQEVLLILDEFWAMNPSLHHIPIYYASSLARRAMTVYQTFVNTMSTEIQQRFARRDNPFHFRHVHELKDTKKWADNGPCVMLSSPGMLQSGYSRELLEAWAPDPKNGLIICGYCVNGTMAKSILREPEEILGLKDGRKIPRRMSVKEISFSAHVDGDANIQFIQEVGAQHVVLVHGEQNNMTRLKNALQEGIKKRKEDTKLYNPANAEELRLNFKRQMAAKAIGKLAKKAPEPNTKFKGLLVSNSYSNYQLLEPSDLHEIGLSTSSIIQQQSVAVNVGWDLVQWHLENMFGSVLESSEGKTCSVKILGCVDVRHVSDGVVMLEWESGLHSDTIADSILALMIGIDRSPASLKLTARPCTHEDTSLILATFKEE